MNKRDEIPRVKNRHAIRACVYGAVALVIMYEIFSFSGQVGETSSSLSDAIAMEVASLVYGHMGIGAGMGLWEFADSLTYPIRKIAHISEYALLAGSVASCVFNIRQVKYRLDSKELLFDALIALAICVLYASTDEFHQTFIPGRTGQPIDVAIDSIGIIVGALVVTLLITSHKICYQISIKIAEKSHSNAFRFTWTNRTCISMHYHSWFTQQGSPRVYLPVEPKPPVERSVSSSSSTSSISTTGVS